MPAPVENLLEVARLRVTARRAGLADVGTQGQHVRFGPLDLRESQQMRLARLYPGSLVKPAVHTVLVPRPKTARVGGQPLRDRAVLEWARQVIEAVLVDDLAAAATVASST
jgi:transcription-repair coupling factor (superfamily II helicase)